MDNEQLLDKVQNLLLGMEDRTNTRFDGIDSRLDGIDSDLKLLDRKVESVRAEVKLHNELLAPFITWSHRIEDEVIRSAQLQAVESRLAKLEKPQ